MATLFYSSPFITEGERRKDEMEAEMRRLKLELRQTKEMYNLACKEALIAKQKIKPKNGNFFEWAKEDTTIGESLNPHSSCSYCSNMVVESLRYKNGKLHRKAESERRKSNDVLILLLVSWGFFLAYFFFQLYV